MTTAESELNQGLVSP